MTSEMFELARRNAIAAEVDNVEFLQGYLEDIPLPDGSVDVVISNCVINLTADKHLVLAEAARVLRSGGRLAFSDVIADEDMDEATKADMAEWTGCIGGALTRSEFTAALTAAGFTEVKIRVTHRVHAHAQAAVIRATQGRDPSHTDRSERKTMGLPIPMVAEIPEEHADLLAPAGETCCAPAPPGEACCTPSEKSATGCCAPTDQGSAPQDAVAVACC
ncbi:MAG: arsenite methyltransferase [Actinomycetota bacterium]|nr:arsenite methyltransferase [Actinomycetota bacterium]